MAVKLLSSSNGSVTLDVPVTSSNFALTLPAANGTVITTGSTGQVIPKAALPTGSVLQVIQATTASPTSTGVNDSTYIATGLSATITPTSATSKILILIMARIIIYEPNANGETGTGFAIFRNGSSVFQDASGYMGMYINAASSSNISNIRTTVPINYLDSPSSTSALTYVFRINSYLGRTALNTDGQTSVIILMEIAA
jgi:hypothetical protein